MNKRFNIDTFFLIAIIAAFIILVPIITDAYTITVINSVLYYFVAGLGITIMLGMGGQVAFSTTAFTGMGSFVTAYLSVRLAVDPAISVMAAIIFTGIFAFILGLLIFRLSGSFVTFATLALTQIMYGIYQNWKPITGGADGISNVPNFSIFSYEFDSSIKYFYLFSLIALICALFVERLRKTSFGRALATVRDNELAAQTLGVNVYMTKVFAFSITGMLGALGGSMMTQQNNYVSSSVFTFDLSTRYLIMVMLGGVMSTPGAFVGTALVVIMPELLKSMEKYIMFIFGILVILLMIFMPMGLAGFYDSVKRRIISKSSTRREK